MISITMRNDRYCQLLSKSLAATIRGTESQSAGRDRIAKQTGTLDMRSCLSRVRIRARHPRKLKPRSFKSTGERKRLKEKCSNSNRVETDEGLLVNIECVRQVVHTFMPTAPKDVAKMKVGKVEIMNLRIGLIGYGSWTRMAYHSSDTARRARPYRLGSRAQRRHAAAHPRRTRLRSRRIRQRRRATERPAR